MTSPSYQIPTEVREFAEKSVEQARKAFEGFSGAAQKAIAAVDTRPPRRRRRQGSRRDRARLRRGQCQGGFRPRHEAGAGQGRAGSPGAPTEFATSQFAAFQEQTKKLAPPSSSRPELGAAFTKAASPK